MTQQFNPETFRNFDLVTRDGRPAAYFMDLGAAIRPHLFRVDSDVVATGNDGLFWPGGGSETRDDIFMVEKPATAEPEASAAS